MEPEVEENSRDVPSAPATPRNTPPKAGPSRNVTGGREKVALSFSFSDFAPLSPGPVTDHDTALFLSTPSASL